VMYLFYFSQNEFPRMHPTASSLFSRLCSKKFMRLTKVAGDTLLSALPYYCSLTILGKARRQKLMCRTGSAGWQHWGMFSKDSEGCRGVT
jgi:hypothetical protein